MNFKLSITDFLLCGASLLLIMTIILLVIRMNSKNFVFVTTISLYFTMIVATCCCILFLHHKPVNFNTIYIPLIFAFVLGTHNVFHYLSIQHLILKTNLFRATNLIHFLPIIIVVILMIAFSPVYSSKASNAISVFEAQNLNYTNKNNYIVGVFRLLHPTIYLSLGGKLVFLLYKTTMISPGTKSIRRFVYFIYFQKIILLFWFFIGLIGFENNFDLYSNIAISAYSLSAFLTSTYVLLNPELSLQITKLIFNSKKRTVENSNTLDLIDQLNSLIKNNHLYLDYDFNLTTLSSKSGISSNTIRETISASGFKNYSAYINSFRINHSEKLIQDGFLNTYSLETLSKESGFQSEATFYRVFKKNHNCTPKEYSKTIS